MAVLSDAEIRRLIQEERLIEHADLERAGQCSYSFVAGTAFHPGTDAPRIDFPGEAIVKPGEMIWIRTREAVKMPTSLVGFWWQTNSLSRKGLMLVNMSMVEPGYEGNLACLFVNFGKSAVPIYTDTVIAKMVFSDIRGETLSPVTWRSSQAAYDADLRELAINQPPSFLQVGELAANVASARLEAIAAVKGAAMASTSEAAKEIAAQRVQALADFKADIPKAVRQSFTWAVAALALLTVASLGAEKIKGTLFPDVKLVAHTAAEQALRDRLTISASPGAASADTAQLTQELKALNARIATLEKKK